MRKILITGSNGFVGQKLLAALRGKPEFQVIAASRSEDKAASPQGFVFERLDITDAAQTSACLHKHRPDVIIHTAAMSLADPCEKNPDECWKINVTGTENILRAAESFKPHFIHLSTDFVFDGMAGPYREEDTPHPVSVYGKSKWASEQAVMKSPFPWAVARTILVYGLLPVMPRPNIITFVKGKLEQGEKINVVSDQFRMPTLAEDLAEGCLEIAARKAEGIFHLSGSEMTSVYDFAVLTTKVFNLNSSLIEPVLTASLNEAAKRPPRTGFHLDKARKILNYRPRTLADGLLMVRNQICPAAS